MSKGGKSSGKGKGVPASGDNWWPSSFSILVDLPAAATVACCPSPPHLYPLASEMPSSKAYRLAHSTVSSTMPMSVSQPTAQPTPASPMLVANPTPASLMDIGVMTILLAYAQLIDALRGQSQLSPVQTAHHGGTPQGRTLRACSCGGGSNF